MIEIPLGVHFRMAASSCRGSLARWKLHYSFYLFSQFWIVLFHTEEFQTTIISHINLILENWEYIKNTNKSCFRDWPTVQQHIKNHPDFNHYFYKCPEDIPWTELDWEEDGETSKETRIPYDVLDTGEAETVFRNHANSLQQEHKRLE